MLAPSDIAGRPAVVTGAAHGIGRAIATRLTEHGARLALLDSDPEELAAVGEELAAATVEADVAVERAEAMADRLAEPAGPPELIVNNVGIETDHHFKELDEASFDLVFRTNLRGPWFLTRALVKRLLEAGRPGAVLFISSVHDSFVYGRPHYSASKAAVAMLTKELARALGPSGIRVNAISPGGIDTSARSAEDLARKSIPLGRAGVPDDVARMALVLLSDEYARYVTGVNVRVDGGASLPELWGSD